MKSFYDILGVSKFASDDEIRKAYILRSKMIHPDRFDQVRQKEEWKLANEMFQELNHAYGVLKDPVSRSLFDRSMGGGYSHQSASPPHSSTRPSPPPRREAEPPPIPKKPQPQAPPEPKGVDMPEWIYKVFLIFVSIFVIALLFKGCVFPKTNSTKSLDEEILAEIKSEKAASRYTPYPTITPLASSSPTATPRAIPTVASDYPEPLNGYVFKNRFASGGNGKLTIRNGCSTHSAVKLVNVTLDTAVYAGFVRANSVLDITGIPDGTYRLLFAAGHGWDDIDGRFKKREGASEFREPLVYTTTSITRDGKNEIEYATISITLNRVVGGTAKMDSISTSDFEKY